MNEELDFLSVDNIEDYSAGASKSSFLLEEGSYDNARVVGYAIVKRTFEGKERKLCQLLWQVKHEDKVYNLRGSGWSFSSNEKSTFRIEVSKWFNKTSWADIVELLIKGGILVKNDDGTSARFDVKQFIGKYGKLLIEEKTSKKGTKYNVIKSISPAKKKDEFEWGEIPSFLVENDDVIKYELADGVKIHVKQDDQHVAIEESKEEAKPTPQVKKLDGKDFLNQQPEGTSDDDADLPF